MCFLSGGTSEPLELSESDSACSEINKQHYISVCKDTMIFKRGHNMGRTCILQCGIFVIRKSSYEKCSRASFPSLLSS